MQDTSVLVVNDNPVTNLINRERVRKCGYLVFTAEDGQQAVELCLRQPPFAVVMDIDMPVMDGIEATIALKRLHGEGVLPYIGIVGTSASMNDARAARCREVGMLETLSKPIGFDQLAAAIAHAVKLVS